MADILQKAQANRFAVIQDALSRLDDRRDEQWIDDGRPAIEAVEALTGYSNIERSELNKFGRVRRPVMPEKMNDAAPTITPAEATAAFDAAELALAEARERLRVAHIAERETWGALSRATAAWLKQFAVSPLEASRQFCASSVAERAELAAQSTPDLDTIGRQASAARSGTPAAKFGAWRRGADRTTPWRGQKLPSDR